MTDTANGQPTDTDDTDEPAHDDHLESVGDGCGCAEVWEHLSAEREED